MSRKTAKTVRNIEARIENREEVEDVVDEMHLESKLLIDVQAGTVERECRRAFFDRCRRRRRFESSGVDVTNELI